MSDSIEQPYRPRAISQPQPLTILETLSTSPAVGNHLVKSVVVPAPKVDETRSPDLAAKPIDLLTLFKVFVHIAHILTSVEKHE